MTKKKNKITEVLRMIEILKATVHDPIHFYTKGHCYNFSLALKKAFPEAKIVYDQPEGHVYAIIDGIYYDVTGVNKPIKGVTPIVEIKKPHRWSDRIDHGNLGRSYFEDSQIPYFRGTERRLLDMFRKSLKQRGVNKRTAVENVIRESTKMALRTKEMKYNEYINNRLVYLLLDTIYEVDNVLVDPMSIQAIVDACLSIHYIDHEATISSYFNPNVSLRYIKHAKNSHRIKYGKH